MWPKVDPDHQVHTVTHICPHSYIYIYVIHAGGLHIHQIFTHIKIFFFKKQTEWPQML